MNKLDLTKKFKSYYISKSYPEPVDIAETQYISITGMGDPSGVEFAEKIRALYPVAYKIKFACKEVGQDFVVPKLEGLWSFDESKYGHVTMEEAPKEIPRSEWSYRLLIRMPDFVSKKMIDDAIQSVKKKKDVPFLSEIECYKMNQGKCVQILHVGPFETESESLLKLKTFIDEHGFEKNGEHHEIYLSDFRKTASAKLKTILREPVK